MSSKPLWGPWSFAAKLDRSNPDHYAELAAQLRSLATLVHVMRLKGWPIEQLMLSLRKAEQGLLIELEMARIMFDAMPSLIQRNIIATWDIINRPIVYHETRFERVLESMDQEHVNRVG